MLFELVLTYISYIGGVAIKLRMGKNEDASVEDTDDESSVSEEVMSDEPEVEEEIKEKPSKDKDQNKKDIESLQKIIKVDNKEEKKEPLTEEDIDIEENPSSRQALEHKRVILQSIKDFDFQIKKNQEQITGVNQKIESITKDLDDLVSLYEIVSEQMNPFVGLSKVTKKRLDALENFTREIDILKERTGDLESFAEKSGAKIKKYPDDYDIDKETSEIDELLGEGSFEDLEKTLSDGKDVETVSYEDIELHPIINDTIFTNLTDYDFDMILDKAFNIEHPKGKVDMIIDEFIESLKG